EAQLTEVLHGEQGLLAAKAPARSVVVLSTVSVEALATHARELEKSGIALVDCGVSGGPSAAGEGQLVAMVGGSEEGVAAVSSVLEAFSQLVLHMGPAGSGMAAKIARNLVQYASWAGAFEAQRLAEACGVPLSKLAEAIRVSDQKIGGAATLMFRDTVAPWPADTHPGLLEAMDRGAALAKKDLAAAIELGASHGLELDFATLTSRDIETVFGRGGSPS
ncbi:MAG: NAD(P)-binding domain-containing protein, partial [Actinobacteria bacterium]|nr:NAD(P)-binding domain-containing protein [Actinomycetota bacterium]